MTRTLGLHKSPVRSSLKWEQWPDGDRHAWAAAIHIGDVLEPSGIAAEWAPVTRRAVAAGYGRWLAWLGGKSLLDPTLDPAGRVTPDVVVRYVEELKAEYAPYTTILLVRRLHSALRAMAPVQNWSWMGLIRKRLERTAVSVRNKRARVVPSDQLFAYGLELMAAADCSSAQTPYQRAKRAGRYRDGMIIALLAARPFRLHNFASIEIGRHLVRRGEQYWLIFDAAETKTREPIEAPFPIALTSHLERYLSFHRPVLATDVGRGKCRTRAIRQATKALWVSRWQTGMCENAVYVHIVRLTRIKFGHGLNPHLFRDCAATSIATEDPSHVHITRNILGHRKLATSEMYYNHAQSIEALRRLQRRVLQLRREGRVHRNSIDRKGDLG